MHYEEKKKHISKEDPPLVSIIMPLYNAEKYISEAISSVLSQSYSNWELIILDDASTDNSVAIAEEIAAKDKRIQLVKSTENTGAAICRNRATEMARGEYIAFLDSDDLWLPEKLQKQLNFMHAKNCEVSFSSYLHMDENSQPLNKRIKALKSLSYDKQHSNNYIGNLTGMYNAAALGKIIAPNIRKRQDWAVWLEAIKRSGKPALGLQEDLACYRVRKGSMSARKMNLVSYNFQFYKNYLGHSLPASCYYLVRFFWEYFLIRPQQIEKL
jgi:glycosyltransferase involved in cell wall biosynthesis